MIAFDNYDALLDEAWSASKAPRSRDALKVVSTFAGCGGSSLGYHMAGLKELLAVEWEDHAAAMFKANFPSVPLVQRDIVKMSVSECLDRAGLVQGELDILDGSPPCQGFSTSGARDMSDSRNTLFREYARLLSGLMPRAFVMENVSGMVKGDFRLVFVEVLRVLKKCGYRVAVRLLNTQWFGVPQSRERLVFIGLRDDIGVDASHPLAWSEPISIRSALDVPGINGVREGFGPTHLAGVRTADFENKWRPVTRPCPTVVKTRPPILRFTDGSQREMTAAECMRVCSFPPGFVAVGPDKKVAARAGNCVPPLFMRSIAQHVARILTEATK